MKLSDLTPNEKNPRKITDARLEQLKRAIKKFGSLDGFVYNRKSKRLVSGHQRQKLGADSQITITKKYSKPSRTGTVAEGYVVIDGERFSYRETWWDDATEKAANIAANKGAGEWDLPQLGEWLKELNSFDLDFDISLTMFDDVELKEFGMITVGEHTRKGKTGVDEDAVPEKAQARSKLGSVYRLGEHRLMCGDSTDKIQIAKLLKGQTEAASITFTSPPYNAGKFKVTGTATAGKKMPRDTKYQSNSDDMTAKDYEAFLSAILENFLPLSQTVMLNLGMLEDGKRSVIGLLSKWVSQFKDTIYWRKSTSTPHIQPGIMTCLVEPIFCFGEHNTRQFKSAKFRGNFGNVVEGSNAGGNEFAKVHAATFPVYLPEAIIENFTGLSGVVIDPFGGTGSTLIACEKTHRKCFMMEIDPHYCDVIVERWEKYTGLKAKLLTSDKVLRSR